MRQIATIGFFDGVHRGHQYLFQYLRDEAIRLGLTPLIVTFREHPRQVLQLGYQPRLLSSLSERESHLHQYANALVFSFADIRSLTAKQFMQLLHEKHDVDALLVGYDHRFGSDQIADPEQLKAIGQQTGVQVIQAPEYELDENGSPLHISSTEIRIAVTKGDIERANRLLGYPYTLCGTVVHGRGIGRTIGFPTANIRLNEPRKLLPPPGVYAVTARWGKDCEQPAILNIGTNPTLGENPISIELHIPGLDMDLYDREIAAELLRYLRPEKRFDSLDALRKQIEEDIRLQEDIRQREDIRLQTI
ncbi:MAG: riboflavin biosynthesis protein RibF [Paludibacteraceae bacterium]|nr:riboflavin biosynthesis protein RibF [Paludibacteraceae bacterium]